MQTAARFAAHAAHAALQIRPLAPGDSIAALTALVHRAYAPLAAAGMNFTAASQTEAMTVDRIGDGHCLLALQGDTLVGTVTLAGAHHADRHPWARASAWLLRDDVAHLFQFAVDPAAQGVGLGRALMRAAEQHCLASGRRAVVLDTALPATHLRQRYARAGYVDQHELQWHGKTYRSVLMVKPLAAPAVAADDAEHRVATVRAFWAHFQARDWPAARGLLADDARLYWRASGEHLLDADAIIRVNAIYPEGWFIHQQQSSALVDGRVHSLVEVCHGDQRFLAHSLWRFDSAGRIVFVDETFATVEPPPAWRTAEAIGAYRRDQLGPP
jgi:GNAT superfamily N-acetyltransferase